MESVIQKIREARDDKNKKQSDRFPSETVVDGCVVKIRFAEDADNKVMAAVRSMLMSAHFDATLVAPTGGE